VAIVHTFFVDIDIAIFVTCNWVDTMWQQYSTHLHTNDTQNDTMKQYLERNILVHNNNHT